MDKTYKRDQYPLLGAPQQIFEGDNVYVVNEKAEVGKTYSFVCPQCHALFVSKATDEEVKQVKCPECNTYICFSTKGKEGIGPRNSTRIIPGFAQATPQGILVWTEGNRVNSIPMKIGDVIIGRADNIEKSDVMIDDATASRRSVRISVARGESSGKYTFKLSVLRTTNAVYVNHNVLYNRSSIYLNYGDTIKIGETVFTLLASDK